jgi:hypothetical protein
VTLVDFASPEATDFESALRRTAGSLGLTVRCERSASGASYRAAVIHAIVFSPRGLAQMTTQDVNVIRSATELGTCRVYLSIASGTAPLPEESRLDDFIQRTHTHGFATIAEEIITFFRQADSLNRRSTPLAFRDITCLVAYRLLKYLWPVSYVFAVLHTLNVATVLAGRGPWLGVHAGDYVVPASTFFGVVFIAHCIFVVVRNWLFGTRIVKRINSAFALGAAGFGMAAAATAYSIAVTDQSILRIFVSVILAVAAYGFYMYARRIRGECTSLSQLQAAMADPQRRDDMLSSIGGRGFGHSAFPLFPFRSKTLFISYMHGSQWSSETAILAHRWASKHELEVFLDRSTIPSGTLWRRSLLRAVSECGFFVAVIDGDAAVTEWVLAESAYAALLRKSIGKPRILLVVRNAKRIAKDENNPIRRIYLDVFQLPPARCLGAAILPVDDDHQLTEGCFLQALETVRPMCLLLGGGKPMQPAARTVTPSMQADATTSDDLQLTDRSWRTSVLLGMLLEAEGRSVDALKLLRNKGFEWIRSDSPEKKTVGLNTLRFLFKGNHLPYSRDLLNEILDVFLSDASLAVKLAALDLLGSMSTTPNPLTHISAVEAKRIAEFRNELTKMMNASQHAYAAKGVHADLARESFRKTYEEALRNIISRVDSVEDI